MPVITLDMIDIDITRKPIKRLYLRVRAPDGRVTLSIPRRVSDAYAREFIADRLPWIKQQQARLADRPAPPACEYKTGESHPVRGVTYPLSIIFVNGTRQARLVNGRLLLSCRPGDTTEKRAAILREWYRNDLKKRIPGIIERYEMIMGVRVSGFSIRHMRARWGSCHTRDGRLTVNLELAKYPDACLDYVVVHEMAHLLERGHNARFYALMTRFFPTWKDVKARLARPSWDI
ncbi:MAG: SprT family zinc-dependent metalloprotease [Lentisphaeria bacterium]|nr:SprT family zinc-dependent metalloprotease [Lentisphaeria bacterium]